MELITALLVLALLLLLASVVWLISVRKKNVALVDICLPIFFWIAIEFSLRGNAEPQSVAWVGIVLVSIWALRLGLHVFIRNRRQSEDRRYQEIRERFNPGFEWKSLFVIFWFQAVLAWALAAPLYVISSSHKTIEPLHLAAIALWIVGMAFEAIADQQLFRFHRRTNHANGVLTTGLWRYTRHPNYFGEFCIAWGFFVFSLPSGGWWTVFAPLALTYFLLRFSGVARMEAGMEKRRPGYREYTTRTNAFFPGRPRESKS